MVLFHVRVAGPRESTRGIERIEARSKQHEAHTRALNAHRYLRYSDDNMCMNEIELERKIYFRE